MILHISRERFQHILDQGHPMQSDGPDLSLSDVLGRCGTHYHLLENETGLCSVCQEDFESIPARTPTELEICKTIYLMLSKFGPVTPENLRKAIGQRMAA